ncbi:hypothetical protein BC937DRAFT_92997 [Endogone sp. FLAS-F59071]|nr:hypothetical protein BC937DRAFT_92997 [Endogone sp. FLAS-F59071]|eukprot:RUS23042.1 hypothetical protein BC937DRAFT_92997 [Endogone sp. FLAS-F59071]
MASYAVKKAVAENNLNPSMCYNLSFFKELMKEYRRVDDNIMLRMNTTNTHSEAACADFFKDLTYAYHKREDAVNYCLKVIDQELEKKTKKLEENPEDYNLKSNIFTEESKHAEFLTQNPKDIRSSQNKLEPPPQTYHHLSSSTWCIGVSLSEWPEPVTSSMLVWFSLVSGLCRVHSRKVSMNPQAFYRQPYPGYPPGAGVPMQTINPAQMATPPSAYTQFRAGGPMQGMMPQAQQQHMHQSSSSSKKRSSQKQKSLPQGPYNDEGEEPSGDELDEISARDIAMARYKRNHDYLAEVFSPYPICKYTFAMYSVSLFIRVFNRFSRDSAASENNFFDPANTRNVAAITGPSLDLPIEKKEELRKTKLDYETEIEQLKSAHAARMHNLRATSSAFWDAVRDLQECATLDELARCQARVEQVVGMRIQDSYGSVRVVTLDLPGTEDDPPKDPLAQVAGVGVGVGVPGGHDDVSMAFAEGAFPVVGIEDPEGTGVDGVGVQDDTGVVVGEGYGGEGLDLAMAMGDMGDMVEMGDEVHGGVEGVDEEAGMAMIDMVGMDDVTLDFLNETGGEGVFLF